MKPLNPFVFKPRFRTLAVLALLGMNLWPGLLTAAPTSRSQTSKTNSLRSVFILPANPTEGRDPFFPKSNRPYEAAMTTTKTSAVDISALVIRGISGPPDHRLVVINSTTFAAGDVADVFTDQGRIRVHCVEIKPRSVVIEIRGQYHELTLDNL